MAGEIEKTCKECQGKCSLGNPSSRPVVMIKTSPKGFNFLNVGWTCGMTCRFNPLSGQFGRMFKASGLIESQLDKTFKNYETGSNSELINAKAHAMNSAKNKTGLILAGKRGTGNIAQPKAQVRNLRKQELSAKEAAILLGVSRTTFYRLVEGDFIKCIDEGVYLLKDVIEGYAKSFQGSKGLTAAKIRQASADAELKEIAFAEQKGELVPIEVVVKVYAENISNVRTKLLAMPTKIAPELVGKDLASIQAKIKHEIYEILKELADYDKDKVSREAANDRKGRQFFLPLNSSPKI